MVSKFIQVVDFLFFGIILYFMSGNKSDVWRDFRPEPGRQHITFEKNNLLLPELAILGWLHFSKAFDQALEEDAHPCEYEIHYIVNGEVNWWVEESNYILRAGTMLVIRPGERHGSRTGALEPCEHFWLRIALNEESALPGIDLKQTQKIKSALDSFEIRAFPVSRKIGGQFQDIVDEHRAPNEYSRLVCRALLHHLLVSVIRDYTAEGRNLGQSDISEGIQNCIKEITQNLDSPPTIEQLAKSMSISETAYRKIFRQQVGYSPLDFINRQRVREAEQLLSQGSWHIKEVSHRQGFSSSQYFSTVFKRVTGVSPGEFLKKLKTQV